MIKMGWIGCGNHARRMLLPQLSRNGIRIVALCDLDQDALNRTAEQFGVTARFTDLNEMIVLPSLDAIGMAVGPDLHKVASIAALKAGKSVFIEKPPATTAAEAAEIEVVSAETGKPVFVGFMKRYSIGNRIAKNFVQSGEFGDILGITGVYMTAPSYFEGENGYSGFYLHHCVHYMDLIPWLINEDFGLMSVRSVSAAPGKILMHLGFQTESGKVGTVVMGTVQSRGTPMEEVRIMGDHSRLHIDNVINVSLYRDPPLKAEQPGAILDQGCDTLSWTPNFTIAENEDHKGYAALLAEVAAALRGEKRAPPTIYDGVQAMKRLEVMTKQIKPVALGC